jgi:hypothetical protein
MVRKGPAKKITGEISINYQIQATITSKNYGVLKIVSPSARFRVLGSGLKGLKVPTTLNREASGGGQALNLEPGQLKIANRQYSILMVSGLLFINSAPVIS